MSLFNKVLWKEGIFIRPQHFQQQDRYFNHIINQRSCAYGPYYYGFLSIEFNHDLLAQGKVALRSASGFFKDGSFFSFPNEDLLPGPLDLSSGFSGEYIFLTALSSDHVLQEVGEDSLRYYRYSMGTCSVQDYTTDHDSLSDIQIGKLQLRLMTDQEDISQYSALPIAKVEAIRPDKKIILCSEYILPIIHVEVHGWLSELCEELYGLINYRANVLSDRLQHAQQSESAVISDFMMLQLLNQYESLMLHLSKRPKLHPEILYSYLVEMLAQLSTYTQDNRRPEKILAYDHDNQARCFVPIVKSLRHCLSMVLDQHGTSINLIEQSHGLYSTDLIDSVILTETSLILGIYADVAHDQLRNSIPNQVKAGPPGLIHDLVSRGIPGIPLIALPVAPRQIPAHANYCYFSFNQEHDLWGQIVEAGSLCLHIGLDYNKMRLELWAIRG